MEPFDPLRLVAPIINLVTETGNLVLNVVSLLLRLIGVNIPFL